jgi:hypothetical protein
VSGNLTVPAALDGVVVECLGVGELILELGHTAVAGWGST